MMTGNHHNTKIEQYLSVSVSNLPVCPRPAKQISLLLRHRSILSNTARRKHNTVYLWKNGIDVKCQ